jgi:hypothetical protein
VAHSHAAEPDGGYFQTAASKFAFLHGLSFGSYADYSDLRAAISDREAALHIRMTRGSYAPFSLQEAHHPEVAGIVLANGGADLGDTADDLMAGDNRVDSRHDAAPLVQQLA